jgi:hypothetical protein
MGNGLTNRSSSIVCDIATLGSFLACGAVSGFLFAALVTRPYLQEFFFIKGDKFLIPRYSYWFAFSLLQLFGLNRSLFRLRFASVDCVDFETADHVPGCCDWFSYADAAIYHTCDE